PRTSALHHRSGRPPQFAVFQSRWLRRRRPSLPPRRRLLSHSPRQGQGITTKNRPQSRERHMTEPQQAEEPKPERRLEKEIEINAPIEEVWRALTDALSWLTIEGLPNSIEVQAWLSAFAVDPSQIESFSVE